jgi:hypothetical protein
MPKPSSAPISSDRTRITRSLSRSLSSAAASENNHQNQGNGGGLRGMLRCRCDRYLLSPHDQLIECVKCFNWCHLLCAAIDPLTLHIASKTFVCDFCKLEAEAKLPVVGSKRPRASPDTIPNSSSTGVPGGTPGRTALRVGPPPRQVPVKLSEVRDRAPHDDLQLHAIGTSLRSLSESLGFDMIEFGVSSSSGRQNEVVFTDELVEQCMSCCSSAIADATFSDSYPRYCMKEVQQQHHPYLQATVLRCKATQLIVSLVFSNGMDPYGNLKSTIAQLRRAASRASSTSNAFSAGAPRIQALAEAAGLDGSTASEKWADFAAQCFNVTDFSDFVHITLTATHSDYRSRGLAKIAMLNELVRWLRRGRNRAFLNMALEKRSVPSSAMVTCAPPLASRKLYHLFGFQDVFPRVEKTTGEFRWTPQEADMGRVMANFDVRSSVMPIADDVARRHRSHLGLDHHVDDRNELTAVTCLPSITPALRLRRR